MLPFAMTPDCRKAEARPLATDMTCPRRRQLTSHEEIVLHIQVGGGGGGLKRADASPGGTGSRSDGASVFESDRDSGEFVALSFAPAGARGSTAEREYTV